MCCATGKQKPPVLKNVPALIAVSCYTTRLDGLGVVSAMSCALQTVLSAIVSVLKDPKCMGWFDPCLGRCVAIVFARARLCALVQNRCTESRGLYLLGHENRCHGSKR